MKSKAKIELLKILLTAVITAAFTFAISYYLLNYQLRTEQLYWIKRSQTEKGNNILEKQIYLMETVNADILTAELLSKELKIDLARLKLLDQLPPDTRQIELWGRFNDKLIAYHKHIYAIANELQTARFYFGSKLDSALVELTNALEKNYKNNFLTGNPQTKPNDFETIEELVTGRLKIVAMMQEEINSNLKIIYQVSDVKNSQYTEIKFELDDWSDIIAIGTPIILLLWFYYSQRQNLSATYFSQVGGIYAGFTTPKINPVRNGQVYSGIIMNIRSVDSKGFFKGDFDYAETESHTQGGDHHFSVLTDGVYSFFGALEFEIYRNKKRNPFRPTENRRYRGNLYVVDRMDFNFDNYKIEDYLIAEFSAIHYREMETMKFKLIKVYRVGSQKFPDEIVLYKSSGLNFEPYNNLKITVFPQTRVDR